MRFMTHCTEYEQDNTDELLYWMGNGWMDGIFYNIGQFDVNGGTGSEILHLMRVKEQEWLRRWGTPGRFGAPQCWVIYIILCLLMNRCKHKQWVMLSNCHLAACNLSKMFPNIENNMLCCQIWLTQSGQIWVSNPANFQKRKKKTIAQFFISMKEFGSSDPPSYVRWLNDSFPKIRCNRFRFSASCVKTYCPLVPRSA